MSIDRGVNKGNVEYTTMEYNEALKKKDNVHLQQLQ